MKHIFLLGVIVYSAVLLMLGHWPSAVNETGTHALPYMALMLVDAGFIITAVIKLGGKAVTKFFTGDEGEDVIADDLEVSDSWFYGLFGLNLLANLGYHGWLFANLTGAESFGYSIWFLVDVVALAMTALLFHAAQRKAKRAAKSRDELYNNNTKRAA